MCSTYNKDDKLGDFNAGKQSKLRGIRYWTTKSGLAMPVCKTETR